MPRGSYAPGVRPNSNVGSYISGGQMNVEGGDWMSGLSGVATQIGARLFGNREEEARLGLLREQTDLTRTQAKSEADTLARRLAGRGILDQTLPRMQELLASPPGADAPPEVRQAYNDELAQMFGQIGGVVAQGGFEPDEVAAGIYGQFATRPDSEEQRRLSSATMMFGGNPLNDTEAPTYGAQDERILRDDATTRYNVDRDYQASVDVARINNAGDLAVEGVRQAGEDRRGGGRTLSPDQVVELDRTAQTIVFSALGRPPPNAEDDPQAYRNWLSTIARPTMQDPEFAAATGEISRLIAANDMAGARARARTYAQQARQRANDQVRGSRGGGGGGRRGGSVAEELRSGGSPPRAAAPSAGGRGSPPASAGSPQYFFDEQGNLVDQNGAIVRTAAQVAASRQGN